MIHNKKTVCRRKLLKSLAAGGGAVIAGQALPESWTKPVIDTVMLPAHAATTDDVASITRSLTTTTAPTTTPGCCLTAGLYCGAAEDPNVFVEVTVVADGTIKIHVNKYGGVFTGTGSIPCTGGEFNITLNSGSSEALRGGSGGVSQSGSVIDVSVNGTVVCGQTSIIGAVVAWGTEYFYQAVLNSCKL